MKNRKKALNQVMDTGGLVFEMVSTFYNEFWISKDYEWWYKVEPGDVVVDLGACIGMMSADSLDKGASKVYMVEGNRNLLKAAIKNVSEYIMNEPDPRVYPINAIIGSSKGVYITVEDETTKDDVDKMLFEELIDTYNINKIDFLKVDIEGAEYDVFTEENLEYMMNNIKHIAIEIHTHKNLDKFFHFRDTFLNAFRNSQNHLIRTKSVKHDFIWDDNYMNNLSIGNSYFMLYITRI